MILLNAASEWAAYLGHYHPVVVHLPIGFLFLALLLEIVGRRTKARPTLAAAIRVSLLAGFLSAVLACVFGWFLSWEGGYEADTLSAHQWMGIGVALVAGGCWWLQVKPRFPKIYMVLLGLLFVLLMATGHLGGNMTHGADYLTAGLPQPVAGWLGVEGKKDSLPPRQPIADVQQALVYADLVVPILQEKCYSCHSSSKIKGGLRVDEEKRLFEGGKYGLVIMPGHADKSPFIERLLLPASDDKRMPPPDQPQLTDNEIALLRWWVSTGADTKKKVIDLQPDSTAALVLASFQAGNTAAADTTAPEALSKVFDLDPPAPDPEAIKALQQAGILVVPVAKDKNLLEVSAVNAPGFSNEQAALLLKLQQQIVWLKLGNTAITDQALQSVGQLSNLVRLDLSHTAISDAGLSSLSKLTALEYLNMVHTGVTDAGISALAKLPLLRQLYCWDSKVTEAGAAAFTKIAPQVKINY
ncbi:MAG: hypothetical protein P0Y53_11690 [Candidatus Pseudobacter hemicellulosilyticus]|uniref:Uncharacterized protein n=1 Tax=Candidatus Pseudobacter hemicellulosilyticus TaxID=3121375 RepID=A0AAJ5WZB0_9BACT|nr:MAG: hypothetical protein P0Y53_11690 [Pseudobacter sp.]